MKLYTSKPTTVEACQWRGDNITEILAWTGEGNFYVSWTLEPRLRQTAVIGSSRALLWVAANQRWLPLERGEWIIKDSLGFYPCKDEAFQRKYEPVAGSSPEPDVMSSSGDHPRSSD